MDRRGLVGAVGLHPAVDAQHHAEDRHGSRGQRTPSVSWLVIQVVAPRGHIFGHAA